MKRLIYSMFALIGLGEILLLTLKYFDCINCTWEDIVVLPIALFFVIFAAIIPTAVGLALITIYNERNRDLT